MQRIHTKYRVKFSLEDKEKYLRMSSAAVVIDTLGLSRLVRNMGEITSYNKIYLNTCNAEPQIPRAHDVVLTPMRRFDAASTSIRRNVAAG